MNAHVVEAVVLGVPFVAAIVYLVVEIFDFKVWWNRRRNPPQAPKRKTKTKPLGDTWPDEAREEAKDKWREMLYRRDDGE